MALALYRKYRPRTFAEVIGQEHVTEPLSQALRSGRLNHAYLFSGPRGCGKTSSARILARSLNCERGPTPEPCGECQSCRDLAPDGAGSIDVIEIDAASHGGVDDARDLRERAFFAPVSSRFKVYVIDEAHMVSSAGFNALLKLVEEPPEYVKFVFATTEPEKVLGTIKSRTHHYPFRLIPPGVLRPYLEQLTAAEGVKVEPAVFPLVVRAGGGSARDSLSILDQLIAGAGEEGVTYGRAVALLGVTDVALIDEMCDALAAEDGRGAYGVIDRVVEAGHDPRRFAADLLERLRDLIVVQQVPDAVTKGLLDAPHDQLERMGAQAAQLGQATLSRYADIVHNGLTEMRGTTAPRLLLELITARMLLPGADESSSALLQRLERMERRLMAGGVPAAPPAGGGPSVDSPAPSSGVTTSAAPSVRPATDRADSAAVADDGGRATATSAGQGFDGQGSGAQSPDANDPDAQAPAASPRSDPAGAAPPPAGGEREAGGALDAVAIRRVWPEVLALVSGKSKKAAAIVREATVQDVDGSTLVLEFRYATHANMLNAAPEVLLTALQELLGGRWQVRCEVGGQPGGGSGGGGGGNGPDGGGGGGGNRPVTPRPTSPVAGHPPVDEQPSTASAMSGMTIGSAGAGVPAFTAPATGMTGDGATGAPVGSAAVGPSGPGAVNGPFGGGAGSGSSGGSVMGGPSGGGVVGGSLGGGAGSGPSGGGVVGGGAGIGIAGGQTHGYATGGATQGQPEGRSSLSAPAPRHAQDDWPTPATPGGGSAPTQVATRPVMQAAPGDDGWPTPATPGGPNMTPGGPNVTPGGPNIEPRAEDVPQPAAPAGAGSGLAADAASRAAKAANSGKVAGVVNAGKAGSAAGTAGMAGSAGAPRSAAVSAIERARQAASRAANGQRRGAPAPVAPAETAWEGTGADEPPWDDEYDAPVPGPQYPGLDPGDELLDDASAVHETSEEAALRLLAEALGAEKIGETSA